MLRFEGSVPKVFIGLSTIDFLDMGIGSGRITREGGREGRRNLIREVGRGVDKVGGGLIKWEVERG